MRRLTLVIVACLPLAACTILGASGLILRDASPVSNGRANVQRASKLSADAKAHAAATKDSVDQWSQLDPFDLPSAKIVEGNGNPAGAVCSGWQRAKATHSLLDQVAKVVIADGGAPATKPQLSDQAAALKRFLEQNTKQAAPVEGSDRMVAALTRWSQALEIQIAELDHLQAAEEKLKEAEDELAANLPARDEQCRKLLNAESLKGITDPDLAQRIRAARDTAAFRIAYRKLRQEVDNAKKFHKKQRELLVDFLRDYARPTSGPEQLDYDLVITARNRAECIVALDELPESNDFEGVLSRGEMVMKELDGSGVRVAKLRSKVERWIFERGFPELAPPAYLLGRNEAVTKSGRRVIGIFNLPDGVDQWRFWPTEEKRNANPRGDEQFSKEDLRVQPDQPKYVQLAHKYNKLRQDLMRGGATQNEWQAFAKRCDELQKELDEYRGHWGYGHEADEDCRNWAFAEQATLAGKIVANWGRYRAIIDPRPPTSGAASSK